MISATAYRELYSFAVRCKAWVLLSLTGPDGLFERASSISPPDIRQSPMTLTIRKPDDWHLHVRDNEMLRRHAAVDGARISAAQFSCPT